MALQILPRVQRSVKTPYFSAVREGWPLRLQACTLDLPSVSDLHDIQCSSSSCLLTWLQRRKPIWQTEKYHFDWVGFNLSFSLSCLFAWSCGYFQFNKLNHWKINLCCVVVRIFHRTEFFFQGDTMSPRFWSLQSCIPSAQFSWKNLNSCCVV